MMRIGGLASGIDTQDLIAKLIAIDRRPVVLYKERQSKLERQKAAAASIRTQLSELKTALTDLTKPLTFRAISAVSSRSATLSATAETTADPGTYQIIVVKRALAHVVASDRQQTSEEALGLGGVFRVNDTGITVTEDMNLQSIRDAVNEADAGVRAKIIDNTLVFTRDTTGAQQMVLTDEPGNDILFSLGFIDGEAGIKNVLSHGQDAVISVDGLTITNSSNTITDIITGVTLNLHETSTDPVTLDVRTNTQSITAKITAFVNKYNSAVSALRRESGETGVLRGDSALFGIYHQLRRLCSERFADSEPAMLSDIGITSSTAGTLSIDSTVLAAKLSEDAGAVGRLFSDDTGIAGRLTAYLDGVVAPKGMMDERSQSYQRRINDLDSAIKSLEGRLKMREENLARRFKDLEVAMSTMQNQSAWLSMQMAQWTTGANR